MHTGRLVLTPSDPFYCPRDALALEQRLREVGFIGAGLTDREGAYLLGDDFLQLVSFLGCSPHIELGPNPDGRPFCHLQINPPTPEPVFLYGRNTSPPRCQACRRRIPEWRPIMQQWQADPRGFLATCPHCGHRQNPASYDWRHGAGCARQVLFVENIFPNEAIPSPRLLQALQDPDQEVAWGYFYIQD